MLGCGSACLIMNCTLTVQPKGEVQLADASGFADGDVAGLPATAWIAAVQRCCSAMRKSRHSTHHEHDLPLLAGHRCSLQ